MVSMSPLNGAPRPGKKPVPVTIDAAPSAETQNIRAEINQRLTTPLSECHNLLRGLRFETLSDGPHTKETLAEALGESMDAATAKDVATKIVTGLLPQLQKAVHELTENDTFGKAVTLDTLIEAVRRVETKEKARRDFSYELMDAMRTTNPTVFNANNNDSTKKIRPKELKRDPDIAALTQHLEAYSSTDARDIADARAAAETALRALLSKRGWHLSPEPLLGPHVNVKELWNKAATQGTGIRGLTDVFLREIETEHVTALDAIESKTGKRLSLPADTISTRSDALLRYYQQLEQSQPQTFLVDRQVPGIEVRPDGSYRRTRDVVSISTPLSKMLLALQSAEEKDALKEEGIAMDLPASFSVAETTKELESTMVATLLNAVKVAEGKNKGGSRRLLSDKEVIGWAHKLTQPITQELLEATYKDAKKIVKEEWSREQDTIKDAAKAGTYEPLIAPPHPDQFTMLQAAFTHELLSKLGLAQALTEISGGIFTQPLSTGVRHADEVTSRLQSLELNESIGQKRLIIETFINTLPDTVEEILKDPAAHNLPTDEKTLQRIRHAAQAFWLLATELRQGRLNVDDVRKKETATLLENFALSYGTLVRRGVVRHVSMVFPEVERLEGESAEEYAERSQRIAAERKIKTAQERDAFRSAQANLIAQDLLGFLQKVDAGEDLRQNFIGTLGRILGKQGKELKALLTKKMNEVETNPDIFELAHTPQTFELRRGRNVSAASLIPASVEEGGFKEMLKDFEKQVSETRRRFNGLHTRLNALRQSALSTADSGELLLAVQKINVEEDEARTNGMRLASFVEKQPAFIQTLLRTKAEFKSKIDSGPERIREYETAATEVRIILFERLLNATIEQSKAENLENEMKETVEHLSTVLLDIRKTREPQAVRDALQLFL